MLAPATAHGSMVVIDFVIGPVAAADFEQMLAMEKENPSPWSPKQLQEELNAPGSWQYTARSAQGQAIIGYILGRTVLDEAEVFRLAVASGYRRQGVARKLLAHALCLLHARRVSRCFLELRSSNEPARKLYEDAGFKQTGCRKKYYSGPLEDAIVMTKLV
jgi:ribosomal-protein-alanine N-acetyltransferase